MIFDLIITIDELKDELITGEKEILKTCDDKLYPTPIGLLEQYKNEGLCIPIPEKNEINNALSKQDLNTMISSELMQYCIKINDFLIKFAYVKNGKTYLLFYHKYLKIFIGSEINALLLKIPVFMNNIIIEKLDKFNNNLTVDLI